MPVRFDADAENYSRTYTLGSQANFSVSCWVNLRADLNNYSTAWSFSATTSDFAYLQTSSDGTTMEYWSHNGGPRGGRILTLGTWYWYGVVNNGTAGFVKNRSDTDTAFTTDAWASGGGNTTLTTLLIGESVFNGEWLNGSIAGFKFWLTALTQDEMEREFHTHVPRKLDSLRFWQPFVRPETVDWSGNGNTLSGGSGTAVDNAGPPIPWGLGQATVILPAGPSTVTGTLAGTLPAVTGSFTGAVEVSGTLAGTLPAVTGSFTGAVEVSGTLAGTLPAVTGSFTGAVEVSGTMAGTLPVVTGAITGSVEVSGTMAGTLPVVTGSFTGELEASGTLAGTLPAVTGSFTGSVFEPTVTAEFAIILPPVTGSFTGISGAVGISAVLNGPSVQTLTVTGVAVERVTTGVAVERVHTGPALVTVAITGPGAQTVAITGPATERDITGPDVQRDISGVGV